MSTMAKVPNAVEILPKMTIGRVRCTSVTDDRQTDRQTDDGRATAYSEREREFTFAKNDSFFTFIFAVFLLNFKDI